MRDRTRIGIQVWNIAKQYNIPQATVHEIINSYLGYCKELLIRGERVDFNGLVSVVPDVITSQFSTTLAYECEKVADRLALPSYTVYAIINTYIEEFIESVLNGIVVEIRGIVVVKPIYEGGKITKVHSAISQSLKNILVGQDTPVTSFRVHTYKSLKDRLCE